MMMTYRNANRWLQFSVFLWLKAFRVVFALHMNFTVEDNDPSILYTPVEAWDLYTDDFPSFVNTTLRIAYSGSYNTGAELLRAFERDHRVVQSSSSLSSTSRNLEPRKPDNSIPLDSKTSPRRKRRTNSAKAHSQSRSPDEGDDDRPPPPVTLEFNFTGSGIFLFGLQPLSPSSIVTIDGQLYPNDLTTYWSAESELRSSLPVFAQRNLIEGPHSLIVTLGPESLLLFDYLIYTHETTTRDVQLQAVPSLTTDPAVTGEPFSLPSITTTAIAASASPNKKKNVATFGAAVGGSVGVLALFSAGLALSIIRRRYRAAKRERADRDTTTDSERTRQRQMTQAGSDSFVPRFFPGTEIPPDRPPTYNDIVNSPPLPSPLDYPYLVSIQQHPYIHRVPLRRVSTDMSYADVVPPDSPPTPPELPLPLRDDGASLNGPPPPSFPEAIAEASSLRVLPLPAPVIPAAPDPSSSSTRTPPPPGITNLISAGSERGPRPSESRSTVGRADERIVRSLAAGVESVSLLHPPSESIPRIQQGHQPEPLSDRGHGS